ncbi:MAG TPA: ABC transporter ATP-binding protein [Acidimicrobiales bacterium]|nr:ABC transporter ATP-binding protein [Acidimicrobiales bacterium]
MRMGAIRRLLPYIRPYRRQMVVMTLAALGALAAVTSIPLVVRSVIDGPIAHHQHGALVPLCLLALALGIGEGVLLCLRRWVLASAATGMESDIRNDFYAHLQRLPVRFHDGWQSGQLLSRATTDMSTIRRFVGYGLVYLVVNAATFAYVLVLLLRLNLALALVTAAAAVPIFLTGRRFERDYHVVARRVQDQQGDLTTLVEEAAGGIRVIKAFGRHRLEGARFFEQSLVLRGTSLETVRMRGRFYALLGFIPNLTLAFVLLGGGVAVSHHALSLGGLVAFVSLFLMLVWPVESLGEILAMAQEASTAVERIWEVFDTEPAIADRPGAVNLVRVEGRLRFEGVRFTYPGRDAPVLDGVDLLVEPGESVALVGATASGKSTLISLVPRLHDVDGGRITLDGHDLRDMSLASLRSHVGVAFEDPTLFSASVRENLLIGCPTASDDDIATALDTAQAGFAHDLPWGLETRVGEQGLSLSGGQRQRLALARAILGRPRVLVLDDPLSALDVHTESLVEEALGRVLQGTTSLVVVHRPSTIALADRVAFLAGGRIVATGSHHDLLESVPAYRAVLAQEADALGPPAGSDLATARRRRARRRDDAGERTGVGEVAG